MYSCHFIYFPSSSGGSSTVLSGRALLVLIPDRHLVSPIATLTGVSSTLIDGLKLNINSFEGLNLEIHHY
jgi:hypothetical protein